MLCVTAARDPLQQCFQDVDRNNYTKYRDVRIYFQMIEKAAGINKKRLVDIVFARKNECKDLLQNFCMTGVYSKTSIEYVIFLYIG